jgi:mRNA interferase RelE/StbE
MYSVLVSTTFQKQFHELKGDTQNRIRRALEGLSSDPFTPRSGMDIKPLVDTSPKKYRIRVGEYRIVYTIEDTNVRVIELFIRGREYS